MSEEQTIANTAEISAEAAIAAVDFVVDKVLTVHPDTIEGLSAASSSALQDLKAATSGPLSTHELRFALNRWLTTLNDAHVEVRYRDGADSALRCLDLPVSWRPQGLIVTDGAGQLVPGDRIASLGGIEEAAIRDAMANVIPVESEYRLRYLAAQRLSREDYLHYLDVLDGDQVKVNIESIDGSIRSEVLPLGACQTVDESIPWVGYDIHEDASLGVFWLDRFEYNQEMVDVMEAFFEQVDQLNVRRIAIDLRSKTGGDSTVAFAFLEHFSDIEYASFGVDIRISETLSQMVPAFDPSAVSPIFESAGMPAIDEAATHYVLPPPFVRAAIGGRMTLKSPADMLRVSGREIFMLTDAGTFSSGNLFAILLRDNVIGTLIGEPTGNRVNFNGSELPLDIPGTDLFLNMSTAKMLRPDSSRGDADAIQPDVSIVTSREDIANGRDPQLEHLLKGEGDE